MPLVLRAAAACWTLVFAVRLIGRRTAGQMTLSGLVVLVLFFGLTIIAVRVDDRSTAIAIGGICTVGLMHVLVSWLKARSGWFSRMINGKPVVLYESSSFNWRHMSRLHLTRQDVMAAARQHGLMRLEQVRCAVVERDGQISIVQDETA
jgi:uncharacterized membrane protein YcaP (DUF421 family)